VTALQTRLPLDLTKRFALGQQQHRSRPSNQTGWFVRAPHEVFQLLLLFNLQLNNDRRSTTTHDEPPCSRVPCTIIGRTVSFGLRIDP
jgi:hypothetical protein